MSLRLTDGIVKSLPAPEYSNKIYYDSDIKGFGCRVTSAGARSFVLNYRTRNGRERRYTIGRFPDWKTTAARREAGDLKASIKGGGDPLADLATDRDAPTVADLCARYEEEHLPKKRASSQRNDRAMIKRVILPILKHKQVRTITFADVEGLHRRITQRGTPQSANRMVALLSKMFTLAIRWEWRADNPAKGVERNPEVKRQRYLTGKELKELTRALALCADQQATNIIRLLLLTGARRGEVLSAQWNQFDLSVGTWVKPAATTKQKADHRIPLSAAALELLSRLREQSDDDAVFVFPGRMGGHRQEIRKAWTEVCEDAGIVTTKSITDAEGNEHIITKPSARLHDLRHTYASILASEGMSLPIIGALLGHTQPQTTARYAHLFDDPLRHATERVGAIVTGQSSGFADKPERVA